jgi:hypothetical protein
VTIATQTFTVNGDKLPIELIAGGYLNQTRAYGPDFSSTGAYHLEGAFFKGNANYTIRAEIAAINGKPPQNKITDDFSLRTLA